MYKLNINFIKRELTFLVQCPIGKADVRVTLNDCDKDNRPKAWVTNYEVLGVQYEESMTRIESQARQSGKTIATSVLNEGIKRIAREVEEICDNNNWKLWSY